jgi:hypothetical protein
LGSYFANSNPDTRTPFEDVAGILRLSHKYDIQNFRRQAIQELKKLFPCTLLDYDSIYPSNDRPASTTVVESIILARECNALELLPCALYFACQLHTKAMIKSFASLPRYELENCILARDRLLVALETQTFSFIFNPKLSENCQSQTECERASSRRLRKVISARSHTSPTSFIKCTAWDSVNHFFCSSCDADFRLSHEVAREKAWNELPGYFGLGTWDELQAAQG